MAKSFHEIPRQAEKLIEVGEQAKEEVQKKQNRVTARQSQVLAAESYLASAMETDENNEPKGDVNAARAQLSMAQNQLAASQRALEEAQGKLDEINRRKKNYVAEIQGHNRESRANLNRLNVLQGRRFGENVVELSNGIAERMEEAEQARIRLLKSMGLNADAGKGSGAFSAGSGGFGGGGGALRGGTGEGIQANLRTPVGGGLGSVGNPLAPRTTPGAGNAAPSQPMSMNSIQWIQAQGGNNWKQSTNNFNAKDSKAQMTAEAYQKSLESYREGVAVFVGDDVAQSFSNSELEKLSGVQNHAFRAGCDLTDEELKEFYYFAAQNRDTNFVTPTIEHKMDHMMQKQALGLLNQPQNSKQTWYNKMGNDAAQKSILSGMLSDLNGIFDTSVDPNIHYFNQQSPVRGRYNLQGNYVEINEYVMKGYSGYQTTRTMIHEMRHAYQNYAIAHPDQVLVSNATIEAWAENVKPGNYKNRENGTREEYLAQPVEWDAKNFAGQQNELTNITPVHAGSWGPSQGNGSGLPGGGSNGKSCGSGKEK